MLKPKVLAVSSTGGHWEQLLLLSAAFEDCDVVFASTNATTVDRTCGSAVQIITDTSRTDPLGAILCLGQCVKLVAREKPDIIVSTGALPGLICLLIGRMRGAHTIWVDSLANSERPSVCGRIARYISNHWFTQWEHLARAGEYEGQLL